jgi:hypothetical protein
VAELLLSNSLSYFCSRLCLIFLKSLFLIFFAMAMSVAKI